MNKSNDSGNRIKVNISSHLKKMARLQPYKRAVVYPAGRDASGKVAYTHLTFRQLDMESDCLATGLELCGISRGTRTILMATPSLEFFALTFALFKVGAIPVLVDPGMGIFRMLNCIKESSPTAFIGIPKAHVLRILFPQFFKNVHTKVTIGKRLFWGGQTLKHIRKTPWAEFKTVDTTKDETAAILFTTGSTGPAKGVIYSHGTFDAQVRRIKSHFNIGRDEIDLPTFPLFALFDPALGMTAIIPDMDPTRPASVNPERIIEAVVNHGVTNMFGSPALLNRVGSYGEKNGVKLPSIKRVVSAGAPVSTEAIRRFSSMLNDDTEIHTPYGATEAMPVISIGSKEILSETGETSKHGFGTCIGRPIKPVEVRLIKISDDAIHQWSDDLVVPKHEMGEIVVKGDLVTKGYFKKPRHDALAKIQDNGDLWHRMGDLGWMDNKERIWFCGRKSHRVITEKGTIYTIPCEAVFNNHPSVFRSALVGVGPKDNKKPVICIELVKDNEKNKKDLKQELIELAKQNELTKHIEIILFHKSFPVDIRHNSKIFREKLTTWAEIKIRVGFNG